MFKKILLPGKLGNPDLGLVEDDRLDPRLARLMASMPAVAMEPVDISETASYEESLQWVDGMEEIMALQNEAAIAAMPKFSNLVSSKETIKGVDGNDIDLYIEDPLLFDSATKRQPRPCIVHIHGGGMAFTTAQFAGAMRWRKTMASKGALVVSVEFRNSGGVMGNHPYPAGLNDCASAVKWVHAQRERLKISSLIVSGESGGGNLCIATAIKANVEGWVQAIDGVFSIAPMIFGYYDSVPVELVSWRENEGYQGTLGMTRAMSRVYDPKGEHERDPLAWPYWASDEELHGLPPFIVTNYELDLIRDDGAIFTRRLQAAGVSAISRTITGAIHVVELAMPDLVPELVDETSSSLVAFAKRVGF